MDIEIIGADEGFYLQRSGRSSEESARIPELFG